MIFLLFCSNFSKN